ncbi:DUF4124 domain-containing protein [Neptuniibacter sp.]|uniref:DUF4124 domain-containing protein n=1 Tax=Neptuniibacter sp. TaxID=1962643 RepID=UPI00261EC7E6|nr:DUF4124 domain-containing protein [Neptuniibacter sp.]MCP4596803.1 DUF4124 domain-containing protein [Neptuniibacter sp.]
MRQIYFITLLLLPSICVHADIYTWVDENGVKHFSDRPPQGKELLTSKNRASISKDKSKNINLIAPPPKIPSYQPAKQVTSTQQATSSKNKKSQGSGNSSSQKNNKSKLQSASQVRNAYQKGAATYNENNPDNPVPGGHNKQARILTAKEAKKDKLNKKSKKKLKDKLKSYNSSKKKNNSQN